MNGPELCAWGQRATGSHEPWPSRALVPVTQRLSGYTHSHVSFILHALRKWYCEKAFIFVCFLVLPSVVLFLHAYIHRHTHAHTHVNMKVHLHVHACKCLRHQFSNPWDLRNGVNGSPCWGLILWLLDENEARERKLTNTMTVCSIPMLSRTLSLE